VFRAVANCLSTESTIDWAIVRPVGVAGLGGAGGGDEAVVGRDVVEWGAWVATGARGGRFSPRRVNLLAPDAKGGVNGNCASVGL
jgi:hypothetical protein